MSVAMKELMCWIKDVSDEHPIVGFGIQFGAAAVLVSAFIALGVVALHLFGR